MRLFTLFIHLGRNDLRLIFRDPLLLFLFILILFFGFVARHALPTLDLTLAQNGVMPTELGGPRFSDTYPLWLAYFAYWQTPLIPGIVFSFLLIEEKEDGTLVAMRVTPIRFRDYLAWRVTLPCGAAFLLALIVAPVIGLSPPSVYVHLAASLGAAPIAPITTLAIAAVSRDKVQGFAFTKFTGVAGLLLLVSWWVTPPWQWLFGIFPPFLICKGYWMSQLGSPIWWIPILLGSISHFGILAYLIRRSSKDRLS